MVGDSEANHKQTTPEVPEYQCQCWRNGIIISQLDQLQLMDNGGADKLNTA